MPPLIDTMKTPECPESLQNGRKVNTHIRWNHRNIRCQICSASKTWPQKYTQGWRQTSSFHARDRWRANNVQMHPRTDYSMPVCVYVSLKVEQLPKYMETHLYLRDIIFRHQRCVQLMYTPSCHSSFHNHKIG